MRFNKFDRVVKWYNDTKPIISKNHTAALDVRPIGERKRKWERIKKVDENTYALLDGNYGSTMYGNNDPTQAAWELTMAPITWMRREDGDFIRIRNHNKGGCSVTRYDFLRYNLPEVMNFHYHQDGKHWVLNGAETHYLPKCNVRLVHSGNNKVLQDDDMYLIFRANEDGTFSRVGDKLPMEVNLVDKELKKQWRERLDAFYNHCAAIAPMLDTSWDGHNNYANMLKEYMLAEQKGNLRGAWIRDAKSVPVELVREVVATEDHPMRIAFAALVIRDIGGKRVIESQDDVRAIKAAYNRVMNKALGFYKIEER